MAVAVGEGVSVGVGVIVVIRKGVTSGVGAVRTARGAVGTGCSSAATKVGAGLSPQAVKNAAIARTGRSPTRRLSRMRILYRCETTPQAAASRISYDTVTLRRHGDSDKPPAPDADLSVYSKRTTANDQVKVMRQLGFESFHMVGHDRGAHLVRSLRLTVA